MVDWVPGWVAVAGVEPEPVSLCNWRPRSQSPTMKAISMMIARIIAIMPLVFTWTAPFQQPALDLDTNMVPEFSRKSLEGSIALPVPAWFKQSWLYRECPGIPLSSFTVSPGPSFTMM